MVLLKGGRLEYWYLTYPHSKKQTTKSSLHIISGFAESSDANMFSGLNICRWVQEVKKGEHFIGNYCTRYNINQRKGYEKVKDKKYILELKPMKGREDDSSESERMTLKRSMSPTVDNICASGHKEDKG